MHGDTKDNTTIAAQSIANKRHYATMNGYDFIVGRALDRARPPHWAKIVTLFDAMIMKPDM